MEYEPEPAGISEAMDSPGARASNRTEIADPSGTRFKGVTLDTTFTRSEGEGRENTQLCALGQD